MSAGFKSGVRAITSGALEMNVTDMSLDFTPTVVRVSVRQPSGDAELISAYVAGTPTTSGFTAVFSSPVPSDGYILDWTAFADAATPGPTPSGDTLAVSYTDLRNEVARFLGYDTANLTNAQASEVDGYIQSGIRQFYYPPNMEGVDTEFEWSFLRQTASVQTSANVSDYLLSDGFGRVAGQLTFSDSEARHSVPVIPFGDLRNMMSGEEVGRPRFAAIASQNTFGSRGQRKKIYFYPTPDKAYTLNFVGDSDTGKLDATDRPFPLGGPMYSELVIESCLAIAEQKANDEMGAHTEKFKEMLVSTISRDRKSGAQTFGKVGDPDGWRW